MNHAQEHLLDWISTANCTHGWRLVKFKPHGDTLIALSCNILPNAMNFVVDVWMKIKIDVKRSISLNDVIGQILSGWGTWKMFIASAPKSRKSDYAFGRFQHSDMIDLNGGRRSLSSRSITPQLHSRMKLRKWVDLWGLCRIHGPSHLCVPACLTSHHLTSQFQPIRPRRLSGVIGRSVCRSREPFVIVHSTTKHRNIVISLRTGLQFSPVDLQ